MATNSTQRPEKVFLIGFVSASVFAREVGSEDDRKIIRSVNVQKRYLDGEDVKYTHSFGLAELPQALRVMSLATEWVESKEANVELAT